MTLKPGSRWKSVTCGAEAVVIRPPTAPGLPQCGGHDMVPLGDAVDPRPVVEGFGAGCALGKRYRDDPDGIELLCTRAGAGTLGFGGVPLTMVATRQLPSTD
jgi:hypothetical protein